MSAPSLAVVILAAGAGKRMRSSLPKPLHPVAGKPMLQRVVEVARELEPTGITVVGSAELIDRLQTEPWGTGLHFAIQETPQGTGDAVRVAMETGIDAERVLVLYSDHPLVTADTLESLLTQVETADARLSVMTCTLDDAAHYGRVERDDAGRPRRIVEYSPEDLPNRIGRTEINSGIMLIDCAWGQSALARLQRDPAKGEYLLTDLVAMSYAEEPGRAIGIEGSQEVLVGINDRFQLAEAETLLRDRKNRALQQAGVTVIAPVTNLIDDDVEIEQDTVVGPFCVIESGTRVGRYCRIGPNAVIRKSSIGDRVRIESSTIENSSIGDGSDVGPYAHVRGGSWVGTGVHIGNFAELKNAEVAEHVRIGHFSYVGDAQLGADVNIGAGTVTCNFDGIDKHRTEIGPGAFIGSDTMLIAPVSIGAGARTGAGSVVTRDVAAGATVVGMPARPIRRSKPERTSTDIERGE